MIYQDKKGVIQQKTNKVNRNYKGTFQGSQKDKSDQIPEKAFFQNKKEIIQEILIGNTKEYQKVY